LAIPDFREDGWLPVGHHTATWEEVSERFDGTAGGRRAILTERLLKLRDDLRACGVSGIIVLDGSYISAKLEPGDFDLLLIAPADIQVRKDTNPSLADILDAEASEQRGYSLFYIPDDSPMQEMLRGLWDFSKEGVPKGIVEVAL
jgi:hypothetical protein